MDNHCNQNDNPNRFQRLAETHPKQYNYIINTSDFDISLLNGGWWLSDELASKGDRYLFDLKFDTSKCKTKHLEMIFSRAEVIRE